VFFKSKALQQAAALPLIWTPTGVEVALITSRGRGRWIVPKGWPEKGRSLAQVAAIEAEEEAGILGVVSETPIGAFSYEKDTNRGYAVSCRAFVFPLLVAEQRLTWKEKDQREVVWYPIGQAIEVVSDRGLAKLLTKCTSKPNRMAKILAQLEA
jgi:8-oxo-dGTP pyrophosphatase MutT (NUDIX family)